MTKFIHFIIDTILRLEYKKIFLDYKPDLLVKHGRLESNNPMYTNIDNFNSYSVENIFNFMKHYIFDHSDENDMIEIKNN